MKVQGRDCTLTVAKDGEYYPLPYSEETVRQRSKGYFLPAVIGKRNREKFVATSLVIEGCFVTRLDYNCILALFLCFLKTTLKDLTCMQTESEVSEINNGLDEMVDEFRSRKLEAEYPVIWADALLSMPARNFLMKVKTFFLT